MEFAVLGILSGFDSAQYFNYFFTLVMIGGWVAFGVGILASIIGKS